MLLQKNQAPVMIILTQIANMNLKIPNLLVHQVSINILNLVQTGKKKVLNAYLRNKKNYQPSISCDNSVLTDSTDALNIILSASGLI